MNVLVEGMIVCHVKFNARSIIMLLCNHLTYNHLYRWVYIIAMAIYTLCTIICGISKNIGMFFAFRVLQGSFACVGQALGSGSVSDMFESHERGKAMSYYVLR